MRLYSRHENCPFLSPTPLHRVKRRPTRGLQTTELVTSSSAQREIAELNATIRLDHFRLETTLIGHSDRARTEAETFRPVIGRETRTVHQGD